MAVPRAVYHSTVPRKYQPGRACTGTQKGIKISSCPLVLIQAPLQKRPTILAGALTKTYVTLWHVAGPPASAHFGPCRWRGPFSGDLLPCGPKGKTAGLRPGSRAPANDSAGLRSPDSLLVPALPNGSLHGPNSVPRPSPFFFARALEGVAGARANWRGTTPPHIYRRTSLAPTTPAAGGPAPAPFPNFY